MAPSLQGKEHHYPIIAAVALIVIGMVFLLRNLDVLDIGHNWWALFFLIPIAYSLSNAWRLRQNHAGKFPPAARGSLIGSAGLIVVMCVFLFDLNWGAIWPVFLIIGGLAVIFGARA